MRHIGLMVVVAAAACTVADTREVPDTDEVVQDIDESTCPPWGCGNSPEVIKYGLHEANVFGQPDAYGFHLDRAGRSRAQIWDANGTKWDLHIQNNRFFGVSHDGFWQLSGQALAKAQLRVQWYGWSVYTIVIDSVRQTRFPVGNGDPIEVYQLAWFAPRGAGGKNVCNGPYPQDTKRHEELLGMNPNETLIFAGDRIDPTTMTTSPNADFNWFNFGCAGHTLAKLHLTRNTITSQATPDWARRQATLKMFVADYCGKGRPITVSGQPMRWKSELLAYFPTPSEIEARWTENGATCLGKPRLGAQSPAFGDVVQAIRNACGGSLPPACTNADMHDLDGQLRVSAIPLPE